MQCLLIVVPGQIRRVAEGQDQLLQNTAAQLYTPRFPQRSGAGIQQRLRLCRRQLQAVCCRGSVAFQQGFHLPGLRQSAALCEQCQPKIECHGTPSSGKSRRAVSGPAKLLYIIPHFGVFRNVFRRNCRKRRDRKNKKIPGGAGDLPFKKEGCILHFSTVVC